MRTVTGLRPERRDRVRVELDGAPWRTLPAAAVVSAGLSVGAVIDRERARNLRRALRRSEALDAAGRALARRDRSAAGLAAYLERRGIDGDEGSAAVETLERLGYLDDPRFATGRAAALAGRGYGDEAIRFDLEREGVGGEAAEAAIAALLPELERARTLTGDAELDAKAARRLAAKGFSEETIDTLAGPAEVSG